MNRLESRASGTGKAGEAGPHGASPPPGRRPVARRGAPTGRACLGPCPRSPLCAPAPLPTASRAHLVLSMLQHTHALGYLGERTRTSVRRSCRTPGWVHSQWTAWGREAGLGASTRQNLSPQAGAPSAILCPPTPRWSPAHPRPHSRLAQPTYHMSTEGSTSQAPSRSSPGSPVNTAGASPCTGWRCTLQVVGTRR